MNEYILAVYERQSQYYPVRDVKVIHDGVRGIGGSIKALLSDGRIKYRGFPDIAFNYILLCNPWWAYYYTSYKLAGFYLSRGAELSNKLFYGSADWILPMQDYDRSRGRNTLGKAIVDGYGVYLRSMTRSALQTRTEGIELLRLFETQMDSYNAALLCQEFGITFSSDRLANATAIYNALRPTPVTTVSVSRNTRLVSNLMTGTASNMMSVGAVTTSAVSTTTAMSTTSVTSTTSTTALDAAKVNRLVESMYAKVNGAHWIYRGNYLAGIGNSTVLMRSPVLVGSNGAWLGDLRALATGYIPASQTTEFLSQWGNSASLIQQLTSPDYRLNIVYRDNPDEVTGDMTDGLEQVGVLEYAVSRIPGITSAEYLTIAEALYPGLGDLSLSMSALDDEFRLSEHHIYGSSRLGVQRYNMAGNRVREGKLTKTEMNVPTAWYSYSYCDLVDKDKKVPYGNTHNTILGLTRTLGSRYYELTDHLGNVLATVLDRRTALLMMRRDGGKAIDYYKADVVSASDYYPFGMLMPGRSVSKGDYRFGHNGQEKVNEIAGIGNHYTAEFWEYDTRLGRRWNTDPVVHPEFSPYLAFADNPILYADPNGADSAQRAAAVDKAKEYVDKKEPGNQYKMGAKNDPGGTVDCSGLVSKCVQAGGEKNPNYGNEGSGVLNIEANLTQVLVNDVTAGNLVTFRNESKGSYPYHIGVVTDVVRNEDGKVTAITMVHSSGGVGPNEKHWI